MVASESMVKKLWPNEDAIGKCVRIYADTAPCTTVIGIAEDVRRQSMAETEMHYYMPADQFNPNVGGLFVRTRGAAERQSRGGATRLLQPLMDGGSYVTVTPMTTIIAEPRSARGNSAR